jgi:hypothetical protein
MDVKQIVIAYLRMNGYDGLYLDCNCGCEIDDLAPCGQFNEACAPGYKRPDKTGEHAFFIAPKPRSSK